MPDPACLFLDTDVLIQLFIAKTQPVLKTLLRDYEITSFVVPEVEAEIVSTRKFGALFKSPFRKACSAGFIQVLDASNYTAVVGSHPKLRAAGISHGDIQRRGQRYNRHADRGEAYTLATAVMLSQLAASNDITAIRALENAGYELPAPVLRAFDLIVFAYQTGTLDDTECNKICKRLRQKGEFLPKVWQHSAFTDGLNNFVPRLVDADVSPVGASAHNPKVPGYAKPIKVNRIK